MKTLPASVNFLFSGDAALAHAAGHDGRVAGHAAADGEDALRRGHALDILGAGLETDQDDLLLAGGPGLGVLSGEDDLAGAGAGGSAQALADGRGGLEGLRVELGVEQGVEVARLDHQDGLLLIDHPLVHEVAGDLEGGLRGALAVAALEHVELAVFDGELHVLHVAVVILQQGADLDELLVCFGEFLFHLGDGHRGAHAGDDVLALGVGEELTHKLLLAGGGVAGEGDAGAGVLVQVAEDHRHDVDGSAPGIGDVVLLAVVVGARIVPGAEDGANGLLELDNGIGGEVLADLVFVLGLELLGQLLEVGGSEVDVVGDALLFLHLVDQLLEVLLADLHDDVRVHLDESSVAVPCPALVAGLRCDDLDDLFVQAQVKDGVHHAGHGSSCAGTDGNEKRVLLVAELLAGDLFHLHDVLIDLALDLFVDLSAVLIVLRAGFRRDGEALRNRKTDIGHFCQVRALAAEELTHVRIALAEKIYPLSSHSFPPVV